MDTGTQDQVIFDMDQGYYQSYTQEQVDEMNQQLNQTRSQRVRAAMFPETLEEGLEIQPAAASGGIQNGRPSGRRPAEDGRAPPAQQREIPGHHDGLPADSGLWQSRVQVHHPGQPGSAGAGAHHAQLRLREAVVDDVARAEGVVRVLQQQAGHRGPGRHAGVGHASRTSQPTACAELPMDAEKSF